MCKEPNTVSAHCKCLGYVAVNIQISSSLLPHFSEVRITKSKGTSVSDTSQQVCCPLFRIAKQVPYHKRFQVTMV